MENIRDTYISSLVIERFPEMTKEEQLRTTQELWGLFDMMLLLEEATLAMDKKA